MIVVSNGLDEITNKTQYNYLSSFLSKSFQSNDPDDLLGFMMSMKQYFYFKNNKPIAVVSFKNKGYLYCTETYYNNVIYNVATAPYYRNKGIMTKLLRYVFSDLRKQNKTFVYMEVYQNNINAISLYKKLGFELVFYCERKGVYLLRLRLRHRRRRKKNIKKH